MPDNALVTGPPSSGKTTALSRTVDLLREDGLDVGGVASPEIREDGERVGFEIVDLGGRGERRAVMARVDYDSGPTVGKYRVDVDAVDRIAGEAIPRAVGEADCTVIDEIAPMELASDRFVAATRTALDADVPVLAAVKSGSDEGFLGAVKERDDVETFTVTSETRDELPARLAAWVRERRCSS